MFVYQIRKAKPGDEAGIHNAHMRSIREVCIQDHTEAEISGWGNRSLGDRWTEAIKTGYVWVVESNGQIYGHGYIRVLSENGNQHAHVHGLYLAPEAIKKGLAKKLVKLMLEIAREQNVALVTLQSTITAHEFYKKVGFIDVGPMSTMEIGGYPVRYYPMAFQI